MRNILMATVLFIAGSLLVGCKTMGLKKSDKGGFAAFEHAKKTKDELSAEIKKLDLRLKKLEDNQKQ